MKICCISDLHGHQPKLQESDLILISGDLTESGKESEIYEFWKYIEKQVSPICKDVVIIAGNHDFYFEKQNIKPFKRNNIHYLYNSSTKVQGLNIWGTPHTLRYYNWAFNSDEREIFEYCQLCPKNTDIILSHGPPRGIFDLNSRGEPCGSVAIKILCDEINPRICIFGHMHEQAGNVEIDNTLYVNASYLHDLTGSDYKPNNINPFYTEIT